MNNLNNIALQAILTLGLSSLLGAALFVFADYATSGVLA